MSLISTATVKRFWALFYARNLEFVRDRSSMSWNLLFPVLLIAGFAVVFSNENKTLYKAGIVGDNHMELRALKHIEWVTYEDIDEGLLQLKRHQLDLFVHPEQSSYWINPHSPNSYIMEKVLKGVVPDAQWVSWQKQEIEGQQLRYVDWVLPGILGMNMMFSCLFGVGYVIVRYRKNGVLKRLKATPIMAYEFLSAQVLSRLMLTLTVSVLLFTACNVLFGFFMEGQYWLLLLVGLMGAVSMISLGLLMASRTRSEELAGGLLNLISWPMMFLSEVWFSLEGSPNWVITLSEFFPLTHMIQGAREIMINGAGFWDISDHIFIMLAMTIGFLGLGAGLFRWDQD